MKYIGQLNFIKLFVVVFACLMVLSCNKSISADGLYSGKTKVTKQHSIQVLALGHKPRNHHDLVKLGQGLFQSLADKGIYVTYTTDLNDLNTETLNKYDVLLLYANHGKITKPQEKALIDYVESGHGFVPVHCASWCFGNSPAFTALVGGRFKSHGGGVFQTKITNKGHDCMKGVSEFSCWDETYVHSHHAKDRTILMMRDKEPWTWVREQGKGRVFYTASGHDKRCWDTKGFHVLIEKGIVWASGKDKKNDYLSWQPKPLVYRDANVPNYERRKPAPQFQLPLTAEESQKRIQVPVDFDLQLFASEPMIKNPIYINFDDRGRCWVIETVDYPNNILPGSKGNDSIKILEDTNGDGKADKMTVFKSGLNIPTTFTFSNGGILVQMAPYTYFMKDTDGDDKCDVMEKKFGKWGLGDTHAGPSNLSYGLDNHIWGAVGYSGFRSDENINKERFGSGLYRITTDLKKIEWMAQFNNNTWGSGVNEDGDIFGGTANHSHTFHMAIPARYYKSSKLPWKRRWGGTTCIDGHKKIYPITPKIRMVDSHGNFTAAASHRLYTARQYPKEFWNRMSLICEPTAKLLYKGILDKDGSGYKDRNNFNLMASTDEWSSPIQAEVGPDGQVWVVDWYNFIIQHNPVPKGFKRGKGNAHINKLRDNKRGRIYRIVYKKSKPYRKHSLSKKDTKGLVKALQDDNMFWRIRAQRLLVERKNTDVFGELYSLASQSTVDEIGLNTTVIHALWTLKGLGADKTDGNKFFNVVKKCLSHKSAAVRKNAIRVMPSDSKYAALMVESKCINDKSLNTRLAAIVKTIDFKAYKPLEAVLHNAYKDKNNTKDKWISDALAMALEVYHVNIVKPAKDMTGAQLFQAYCISCHGLKGQGSVGPNLTDNFFLHGNTIKNMKKTITEGVLVKGMLPWKDVLSARDIDEVAKYVHSLIGKNVKGKGPEGKEIK